MNPLLELKQVELKSPDGRKLIDKLSVRLAPGELLLVEGPNGSGKTSLLKVILGLSSHYVGEVQRNFKLEDIGYLPQLGNVQFLLPLQLGDVVRLTTSEFESLALTGLLEPDALALPWNTASGGERQKALLAALFLNASKLLVLDEPTNHLDVKAKEQVKKLVKKALDQNVAVILVSHHGEGFRDLVNQSIALGDIS